MHPKAVAPVVDAERRLTMSNNTQAFWKDRLTKTTHKMPVPPTAVFHGEVPVVPELEPKIMIISTPKRDTGHDEFLRMLLTSMNIPKRLIESECKRNRNRRAKMKRLNRDKRINR